MLSACVWLMLRRTLCRCCDCTKLQLCFDEWQLGDVQIRNWICKIKGSEQIESIPFADVHNSNIDDYTSLMCHFWQSELFGLDLKWPECSLWLWRCQISGSPLINHALVFKSDAAKKKSKIIIMKIWIKMNVINIQFAPINWATTLTLEESYFFPWFWVFCGFIRDF